MINWRIAIFTIVNLPNYKPDITFWLFVVVVCLSFLILIVTISCAKILHEFWLLRDFMLDDTNINDTRFKFSFFVFCWYINTLDFYTLTDLICSNFVNFVKLTSSLYDSFGFSMQLCHLKIWQFYYFSVMLFLFLVLLYLLGPPVQY